MTIFRGVLLVIWIAGCIGATIYAQQKHIAPATAVAVGLAFLVEISFYAGLGRIRYRSTLLLAASALVPYLILAVPLGVFEWRSFLILAGLVAALCCWLSLLPSQTDPLFLVFAGAIYLSKTLDPLYPDVIPHLKTDALAQLMWIRAGVASVIEFRKNKNLNFGFVPKLSEAGEGLLCFLAFLPVAFVLNIPLHFAQFHIVDGVWWKAPATFIAILWTVALGEEVFFRGLLLERTRERWGTAAGIVISSVAYGCVHLWFGNRFPNWKHLAMTTALGPFLGWAYLRGGGVRASMFCHALVVMVWRGFFS